VVEIERKVGSRELGLVLLRVAIGSNLVFCTIGYSLNLVIGNPSFMVMGSQGLFPTLVALIVLFYQGPMRLMFFPQAIPSKYFPLALIGFLTIS